MKIILAGCSHTYGSEIAEPWHPGMPEKAYGRYIADHYSADYETIAGPGWSNKWIFSRLYQRLEEIPVSDREDYRVIVGWTSSNRIPIWHPERQQPYHMCPSLLRYDDKRIKKWHDIVYRLSFPKKEYENYEHGLVTGMQNTLTNLGIKYVFHWAIAPIIPTENSGSMIDQSRFRYYNDENNTYWNIYKNTVYKGGNRWANHAPESYHKSFAQEMINFINQGNLF